MQQVYTVNPAKWQCYQEIHKFFVDYIGEEGGSVSGVTSPPETVNAEFTVDVDSIDFYKDLLKNFINLMDNISYISIKAKDEDTVSLTIRVDDVWEVSTIE